MTKDKTVTMSRELAQKVDDLLYIMTGHDSYPRLVHKYGKEWWTPINEMRAEICTLLAAPVVERQPVAEVIATGGPHDREDRVLCELQAELPPIGTKLYASPPAPVAVPSLWYIRVPDEPENPESPCEYFFAHSEFQRDLLLKKKGAEIAIEYVSLDKVKELNQ